MLLLSIPLAEAGTVGLSVQETQAPQPQQAPQEQATPKQQAPTLSGTMAEDEGKVVEAIELPGVADRDREHLLQLLAQKVGQPLDRDLVRERIRALFGYSGGSSVLGQRAGADVCHFAELFRGSDQRGRRSFAPEFQSHRQRFKAAVR